MKALVLQALKNAGAQGPEKALSLGQVAEKLGVEKQKVSVTLHALVHNHRFVQREKVKTEEGLPRQYRYWVVRMPRKLKKAASVSTHGGPQYEVRVKGPGVQIETTLSNGQAKALIASLIK